MRIFVLQLILLISPFFNYAQTARGKYITKHELAFLIDSVLDLKEVTPSDLDVLSYYCSLFKSKQCDSVLVCSNLEDLNFYSLTDEKVLFPSIESEKIPAQQKILLESGYLSYFSLPIGGVVTSNYGWREGRMHKGTDIDLQKGDKVVAAFAGKVRIAGRQGGYGNVVIIMHPNGLETVYAHLSRIRVKAGQIIESGQVIGLGGNTGHSSGSHLHFEMRYKGHPLNPAALISFQDKRLHHPSIVLRKSNSSICAFPSNCSTHTVSRGESWYAIASRYGLSLKDLMALNGVSKRTALRAGQHLRIN